MNSRVILLALVTLIISCKKQAEEEVIKKTPAQLLTQKSWKIVSQGFDTNNNSIIDANEEMLLDCVKDNTYSFFADGSGLLKDNALTCGGEAERPLDWQLPDGDKILKILDYDFSITSLNENELRLSIQFPPGSTNQASKLLYHFGH